MSLSAAGSKLADCLRHMTSIQKIKIDYDDTI